MKKIVTVILVCFCFFPVFAQGEKTAAEIATGKVGAEVTRATQEAMSQAARVEQAVRFMDVGTALRYTEHAMQLAELEAPHVPEVADLSSASNVQNALENAPKKSLHLQEKLANLKRGLWKKRAAKLFSPAASQIKITNLPGEPTVKLRTSVNILSLGEIHQIRRAAKGEFPFPFKDDNRDGVLYRGMRLDNFEDLRNILVNGLETKASLRGIIYTARRPATALTFAIAPLSEGEFPVLIRIPVTQKFLRANPPNECVAYYQTTFYKDIPSDMIEIFTFMKIEGKVGWYQVTLTSDNQLVFTFVETKTILPIIEEDM